MKKILFSTLALIVCAGFCFTSCSKIQEKKAREQFVQDSIQHAQDSILAVQKRAAFVADSLENVRLDSLSIIAWGKTKFGMSRNEVLKTETCAKARKLRDDGVIMDYSDVRSLNEVLGLKIGLSTIIMSFKEDELNRVDLRSNDRRYQSTVMEEIVYDMKKLSSSFSDKYGKPTKSYGSVQSSDFEPDKEHTFATWNIKSKWISIIFGETYDYRYYYRVVIGNLDYPKKKHVDTPAEIAEKDKKKKEAAAVTSNSF